MSISKEELNELMERTWKEEDKPSPLMQMFADEYMSQTKGGRMKTWRIGRLMIAWGSEKEIDGLHSFRNHAAELKDKFHPIANLLLGTHHIARNPRKGAERKRRVGGAKSV